VDFVSYLGKKVNVKIDRPLGSKHPKYDMVYPVNYGFVPGTKNADGEEVDVYLLGVDKAVDEFSGKVIAIVHRLDDDDDKLVVVPDGVELGDEEILKQVDFQEKYFKSEIIRE